MATGLLHHRRLVHQLLSDLRLQCWVTSQLDGDAGLLSTLQRRPTVQLRERAVGEILEPLLPVWLLRVDETRSFYLHERSPRCCWDERKETTGAGALLPHASQREQALDAAAAAAAAAAPAADDSAAADSGAAAAFGSAPPESTAMRGAATAVCLLASSACACSASFSSRITAWWEPVDRCGSE